MTSIRDEFEKAYKSYNGSPNITTLEAHVRLDLALWAARWMAERCESEACNHGTYRSSCENVTCTNCASSIEEAIRHLSKELGGVERGRDGEGTNL